jgi:hypothetical protein
MRDNNPNQNTNWRQKVMMKYRKWNQGKSKPIISVTLDGLTHNKLIELCENIRVTRSEMVNMIIVKELIAQGKLPKGYLKHV